MFFFTAILFDLPNLSKEYLKNATFQKSVAFQMRVLERFEIIFVVETKLQFGHHKLVTFKKKTSWLFHLRLIIKPNFIVVHTATFAAFWTLFQQFFSTYPPVSDCRHFPDPPFLLFRWLSAFALLPSPLCQRLLAFTKLPLPLCVADIICERFLTRKYKYMQVSCLIGPELYTFHH